MFFSTKHVFLSSGSPRLEVTGKGYVKGQPHIRVEWINDYGAQDMTILPVVCCTPIYSFWLKKR